MKPDNLSTSEHAQLAYIAATHLRVDRARALKEGLRVAVTGSGVEAIQRSTDGSLGRNAAASRRSYV